MSFGSVLVTNKKENVHSSFGHTQVNGNDYTLYWKYGVSWSYVLEGNQELHVEAYARAKFPIAC